MSFIQYLSSGGVLHAYDTNARRKTIPVNAAVLQEIQRRLAGNNRSFNIKLPHTVIVNNRTAEGSISVMPRPVVDLSMDDGDDNEPTRDQQTRRKRPDNANGAKRGNVVFGPRADIAAVKGLPDRSNDRTNDATGSKNHATASKSDPTEPRGKATFGSVREGLMLLNSRSKSTLETLKESTPKTAHMQSHANGSSSTKDGDPSSGAKAGARKTESAVAVDCAGVTPSAGSLRSSSAKATASLAGVKRPREGAPSPWPTKRQRFDTQSIDGPSSSGRVPAEIDRQPSAPRTSEPSKTPARKTASSQPSIDLTGSPPKKSKPRQSKDVVDLISDEDDDDDPVEIVSATKRTKPNATKALPSTPRAWPNGQAATKDKKDTGKRTATPAKAQSPPRDECPETPVAAKRVQLDAPAQAEAGVGNKSQSQEKDPAPRIEGQKLATAAVSSVKDAAVDELDARIEKQTPERTRTLPQSGKRQDPLGPTVTSPAQKKRAKCPEDRVDSAHSDGEDCNATGTTHIGALRDVLPVDKRAVPAEARDKALASERDVVGFGSETAPDSRPAQMSASPIAALGLSKQVESVLGKYLEELRGDNEYWNRVLLKRARLSLEVRPAAAAAGSAHDKADVPYSFANLKPLKLTNVAKGAPAGRLVKFQVQPMSTAGKGMKTTFACPVVGIDAPIDMPSYAHYVSIKDNFLAPNVTTMQAWPYFHDEFDYSAKGGGLKEMYELDVDGRSKKLLRLAQAHEIEEYVESALRDLEITWADVLRFLLESDPGPDVGTDEDALQALVRREESCKEDFTRKAERTPIVLSSLAPSTPEKLAKAAALCENFLRMTKFSLWHVARRHMYDAVKDETSDDATADLDKLTCGICLRLDCPYHGALKEYEDADDEDEMDPAVLTDIVQPLNVNHRTRTALAPRTEMTEGEQAGPVNKRTLQYWQGFVYESEEREPFQPCNHPGTSCEDALCSCFTEMLACEKTCACSSNCSRKYQGCTCRHDKLRKNQSIICFEDDRCFCFSLGRECDPDLCGTCGVEDVLDPLNRYDTDILRKRCHHASIQRRVPKRTVVGDSRIHGLGLYAGENIKKHEFVGEYKGELIDKAEADRRGAVYEHQKLSYLFSLNKSQEVDSTYFGTKIRFINHASGSVGNLYPRVFLVNTAQRIALFANEDIKIGDELFFDYGPQFPEEQLSGKKAIKSVPRTHRANALREEFYDVARVRDDQGNTRATKAAGQQQKGRAVKTETTTLGKHGGARFGAGRRPSRKSALPEREGEGEIDLDDVQSAEARLSAYNIADDGPRKIDAGPGAEDESDDFEPGGSAEEESEDSEVEVAESEHGC
ncbi:hypothetical protein B0A55_05917 [Friedmanniomyces simplex]|uniref:SET domain-containing protein n=1 Tax=Friedmanniomyces simplex TaxID=329884 RepID=A0A4U0XI08_9PEZI|nr:hypothetical protein B0A55_05917 [Friedmanniomyces simplex]